MTQHQMSRFARFATATALAAAALSLQVSHAVAAEQVTDGWQHSIVSETLDAPTAAMDGWQHSLISQSFEVPAPGTDGWLSSVVAEQARSAEQPRIAQAPASPTSTHYGYMDDVAFGSAILNVLLIAAGSIVLLRQRHRGTTA